MERIIQDSDAESDVEISPAKPADTASQWSAVEQASGTGEYIHGEVLCSFVSEKSRSQMEHTRESHSGIGHSSQSSKRRRSDMSGSRSSQREQVKRHKTGDTLESSGKRVQASFDFSEMPQEGDNDHGWGLTASMQQEFMKHQPTMFSDVTSTVPNNTMTQRQLEEEYAGLLGGKIIAQELGRYDEVSSLYLSGSAVPEENQQASGNMPSFEVSTNSIPSAVIHKDSYPVEEQYIHISDLVTEPDHEEHSMEGPQIDQNETEIAAEPVQAVDGDLNEHRSQSYQETPETIKLPTKRKNSRTKKTKKKANTILSLIPDSDGEMEAEKSALSPEPKEKNPQKARRTKTSPATFGQVSQEIAVDADVLTDVKHRFLAESTQLNVKVTAEHEPSKPVGRGKGRSKKKLIEDEPLTLKDVEVTREPLQEVEINTIITPMVENEENSIPAQEPALDKSLSMQTRKVNESASDNGKTLYRVGLSKRARIAPLLKSFRK
jgi:hypothetical protein